MDRNSDGTVDGFSGTELPGSGDDSRDADVEGHKHLLRAVDDEIGPDGQHHLVKYTDDADVEGHLFHSGPTTQGEFMKSGPGDNPHGER
jgi:hypothetical protein